MIESHDYFITTEMLNTPNDPKSAGESTLRDLEQAIEELQIEDEPSLNPNTEVAPTQYS